MSRFSLASCVAVAALAGSAMAQVTLSNSYNATVIGSWTSVLDGTAPTFQRPVSNGPNVPSTALSATATAVRYRLNTIALPAAGSYTATVNFARATATPAGGFIQARYPTGSFNPANAVTGNLGSAFFASTPQFATGSYAFNAAAAGSYDFVDAWTTNTATFGTVITTVTALPDPGALADALTGDVAQTSNFTISSASTDVVQTLDSIRIRGLQHTWAGDLQFSLSNGTTSVQFLVAATPATDSRDFGGDYTFQFGAASIPAFVSGGPALIAPGTYAPSSDFTNAFAGASVGGTWTLSITDIATGDAGRIAGFDLNFTVVPTPGAAALLGLGGLAMARRRR